jgi:hypothetical protein
MIYLSPCPGSSDVKENSALKPIRLFTDPAQPAF